MRLDIILFMYCLLPVVINVKNMTIPTSEAILWISSFIVVIVLLVLPEIIKPKSKLAK